MLQHMYLYFFGICLGFVKAKGSLSLLYPVHFLHVPRYEVRL